MRHLRQLRNRWPILSATVALTLVAAVLGAGCGSTTPSTEPASPTEPARPPAEGPATTLPPTRTPEPTPADAAADFVGIVKWLNSKPLNLAELRGQVVLVDFWTYTCINCIRTLPYLRDWYSKYAGKGLVIVGVHSPEFEFEKKEAGVREAIVRESIAWPVAMDNDFETWRAYKNRFWPHKFLIDHTGRVIYDHIGEGAYQETERQIRDALFTAGHDVSGIVLGGVIEARSSRSRVTRELYMGLGWSYGEYLGNKLYDSDSTATGYVDDGDHEEGRFYVQGEWDFDSESVRHGRPTLHLEDYIALKYKAASVNAVVRREGDFPFAVIATLDGLPIPEGARGDDILVDESGRTYFLADGARLYNIVRDSRVNTHELKLQVDSDGFVLHAFTFGA